MNHKIFGFLFLSTIPLIASDEYCVESTIDKAPNLLEGNLSATSNYVFRGISNSDNKPALQGVLKLNDTLAHTGMYLSVLSSSVHFPDAAGKTAHLEIDTIVGIANSIGEHFNYDVQAVRYNYPNAKRVSYNEVIVSVQYYFLTALLGYSPNTFAKGKAGIYVNVGFNYDIPKGMIELSGISISGGVGYYDLARSAGLHSYVDYNFQISKSFELGKALDLIGALQWTNTNGKSVGPARLTRHHVIGTLTLNF